MFESALITALGGEEVLTFVAEQHDVRVASEIAIFVAAAHFADVNNGDALDTDGQVLPGMEQARRLGGPGTPRVREFAAARLGVQLDVSPAAASYLMADALDVRHRLPMVWGRVREGEVAVWLARKVAKATRHLSLEAAAFVDAAVVEVADGRLPYSRFEAVLEAKVIEADLEAAARAEDEAARARFARVGRSNEHGVRTMYIRALGRDIAWFDAALARVADALEFFGDRDIDGDTEDIRRSRAVGVLANPLQAMQLLADYAAACQQEECPESTLAANAEDPAIQPAPEPGAVVGEPSPFVKPPRIDPKDLLPPVVLYLHLAADTVVRDRAGVVRWEGEGPVSTQHVKDFLGPHCRFTIKPVIDLENLAPVDGYEIPGRLREGVHLVSPGDVFPFASNTRRGKDLDHHEAYDANGPPGQTRIGNLGPMTRFHHRIKTFGHWRVRQPFPGVRIWRSPVGEYFLVDNTGTRRLGNTSSEHAHAS